MYQSDSVFIRTGTPADAEALAALEAKCFPPEEAATAAQIGERLSHYAGHFWLLFAQDTLAAFVDGMVTDARDLSDEMYANASLHDEGGSWQMIFGVNTRPAFRQRGYASALIRHAVECARSQGRRGLVLTCKEVLVPWYASLGFCDEGISQSTHGNVVWHQMRLTL